MRDTLKGTMNHHRCRMHAGKKARGISTRSFTIWSAVCLVLLLWSPGASGELTVRYETDFEGVPDKAVREVLESVSQAVAMEDRPPATLDLLRRRAENDVPQLIEALKAQGYYDAKVEVRLDESKKPVRVVFHISPGPVYLLKEVELTTEDTQLKASKKLPTVEDLGLKLNEPARSGAIVDAQDQLIVRLRQEGYPFAKVAERRVVVDHSAKSMTVKFRIDPGPRGRFGPVTVTGNKDVAAGFVKGKVPWRQGDRFNANLLTEAQNRLTETGLFSLVQVRTAESLDERGLLPITIEVRERKPRTVSAGVSYYTDEGVGVKASWEHRNLFHHGERLSFEATVSQISIAGNLIFTKPTFLRNDQSLVTGLRVGEDDTDAYTSRNTELSLLVQREFGKGKRISTGPSYRLANVTQLDTEREFGIVSLPSRFDWDTSDNLLDPTKGGRLSVQAIPFIDTLGTEKKPFFKGYVSYSHYFGLLKRPFLLFAGRAALGSISGGDLNSIPADLRFYAGGGGSIRGYAFQSVSPLVDDQPIGGRSLVELSAEFRLKITDTIGVVTFIDGGGAFEPVYPDFQENIQWGAGTGLRYFTPIGPLRVDFAVPVNRRTELDDPFQIYLSLGQAF